MSASQTTAASAIDQLESELRTLSVPRELPPHQDSDYELEKADLGDVQAWILEQWKLGKVWRKKKGDAGRVTKPRKERCGEYRRFRIL